jgi:hypothetical protein
MIPKQSGVPLKFDEFLPPTADWKLELRQFEHIEGIFASTVKIIQDICKIISKFFRNHTSMS